MAAGPDAPAPLILSLRLDAASFARLDALRRAHFPAERNHLAAHLTLFHALPGGAEAEVAANLSALAAGTPPMPLASTVLRPWPTRTRLRTRCGATRPTKAISPVCATEVPVASASTSTRP